MRTLFVILCLSISGLLLGQDRYIEISEKDAPALKQYKINWHTGIDPVQIKDGSWVLNESAAYLIPAKLAVKDLLDEKILIASDLREYLVSRKVVTLFKTDFIEIRLKL